MGTQKITFFVLSSFFFLSFQYSNLRACLDACPPNESAGIKASVEILLSKLHRTENEQQQLELQVSQLLNQQNQKEIELIDRIKTEGHIKKELIRNEFQKTISQLSKTLAELIRRRQRLKKCLTTQRKTFEKAVQDSKDRSCASLCACTDSSVERNKLNIYSIKMSRLKFKLESVRQEISDIQKDILDRPVHYHERQFEGSRQEEREVEKHQHCIQENIRHLAALTSNEKILDSYLFPYLQMNQRISKIEASLNKQEERVDTAYRLTFLDLREKIENLAREHPNSALYFNEFYKKFYTTLLVYWWINSNKIELAPSKTEQAAHLIGVGIRIIPGAEPIATGIEIGTGLIKRNHTFKKAEKAYNSFSNPKALELFTETLALRIAKELQYKLETMKKAEIQQIATDDAVTAYHFISTGKLLLDETSPIDTLTAEKFADLLSTKVFDTYKLHAFPNRYRKWYQF